MPIETVDVRARAKLAKVWAIVDLTSDAQYRLASASDLLPAKLKDTPFRDVARDILGADYKVTVRYQPRYVW